MNTTDKARAAALVLACLDDSHDGASGVLDEAHAAGELPGLIAALTAGLAELLINTAGEENVRKTLSLVLLDAQLGAGEQA
jgi:hypothetical protein